MTNAYDIETGIIIANLREENPKLKTALNICYNLPWKDKVTELMSANIYFSTPQEAKDYLRIKRLQVKNHITHMNKDNRMKIIGSNDIEAQKNEFNDVIKKDISKEELVNILLKR